MGQGREGEKQSKNTDGKTRVAAKTVRRDNKITSRNKHAEESMQMQMARVVKHIIAK